MKSYVAALAAFASTAIAGASIAGSTECDAGGYVKIVNLCDEDIYFENTPSGFLPIDGQVLHYGDSYSQVFTALPDGGGWSMKLSPDSSFPNTTTQQYEYTWTGADSTAVWYDMSYVNGSPYPNWNFTSSNDTLCDPTSHAYRNPTDDGYGMQVQCYTDVTLTLHLCPPGSGSSSSSSSSASASSVAPSAPASTSVYVAPSSAQTTFATSASSASSVYSAPASSSSTVSTGGGYGNKVQVGSSGIVEESAQTTTAAVVSTTQAPNGVIVTETQVQVVTQVQTFVVTARDAEPTPAHRHKLRHEHRHPHGGRA